MPKTIRKQLLEKADQAIRATHRLDEILFLMDSLAQGRQPAIQQWAAMLLEGHEAVRTLWEAFRREL